MRHMRLDFSKNPPFELHDHPKIDLFTAMAIIERAPELTQSHIVTAFLETTATCRSNLWVFCYNDPFWDAGTVFLTFHHVCRSWIPVGDLPGLFKTIRVHHVVNLIDHPVNTAVNYPLDWCRITGFLPSTVSLIITWFYLCQDISWGIDATK